MPPDLRGAKSSRLRLLVSRALEPAPNDPLTGSRRFALFPDDDASLYPEADDWDSGGSCEGGGLERMSSPRGESEESSEMGEAGSSGEFNICVRSMTVVVTGRVRIWNSSLALLYTTMVVEGEMP